MIEINSEIKNGMIETFNYVQTLYKVNPTLSIPASFISPVASMNVYNKTIQDFDMPFFYKFIITSICKISEEKIEDGEKILNIVEKKDYCYLESLYNSFQNENEEYEKLCITSLGEIFDDELMKLKEIRKRKMDFIEFLTGNEVVVKLELKIPCISKFSNAVYGLISYIITPLAYHLIDFGGERVMEYRIDPETCIITIWSISDIEPYEEDWYEDGEYSFYEDLFLDILKEEAL